MINLTVVILMGLITGWITNILIEGHGLGSKGDIVLGITGAFVGVLIYSNMGRGAHSIFGSLGTALLGAIFILGPFVLYFKSKGESHS